VHRPNTKRLHDGGFGRSPITVKALRIFEVPKGDVNPEILCHVVQVHSLSVHMKQQKALFDQLIGAGNYCRWHSKSERLGGLWRRTVDAAAFMSPL
jgi:hypothetical protein